MSSIYTPDKRWIIQSLLDVDFYKFTMMRYILQYHGDVQVTFALKNRTARVRLAEIINLEELRAQLDHARTLRFTRSELSYLQGLDADGHHLFPTQFTTFLRELRLPEYRLDTNEMQLFNDGQFVLEFSGNWAEVTLWETIALSIVNELYYRALLKPLSPFEFQAIQAEGVRRLWHKVEALKSHPRISLVEFGTRRRFSGTWQSDVTQTLANELPQQFRGTSNTLLAMKHSYLPMGTNAHELPMVTAALNATAGAHYDYGLQRSPQLVFERWWMMYGHGLSIALTDTFGSDFFFADMTEDMAKNWKGLRHDSGDPFVFGERAIKEYRQWGIDPKEKMIIFSDGLDLGTILKLDAQFGDRIMCSYGWGTNLTNDLGLPTLSLVVKATSANGYPTVKLSDNLAKAMGPPAEIEHYARTFGHKQSTYVECTV